MSVFGIGLNDPLWKKFHNSFPSGLMNTPIHVMYPNLRPINRWKVMAKRRYYSADKQNSSFYSRPFWTFWNE